MKMKKIMGRALAAALAVCISLPLASAAGAHTHIWSSEWDADNLCHWHKCSVPNCRTLVPAWADGYSYHVYDSVNDPDCNICGWVRAVDPGHVHTWGTQWDSDETGHWRQCTDENCPGVVPVQAMDYAAHVYDGAQGTSCSVCGRVRFVDPDHTHTWGTQWDSNESFHWYQCTGSGCPGVVPLQAEGCAAHVYDSPQASVCSVCGRSRFVDPSHIHTWGSQWDSNETGHWYQCVASGCPGVVPTQAKGYSLHVYDSETDPDCNVCGITRVISPPSSGLLFPPPVPEADVTIIGRGQVRARPADPGAGDKVTVILTPGEHYASGSLTVTGQSGAAVEVVSNGDGTWSFLHPGEKVRFYAVFPPAYQACGKDSSCPLAAYGDLSPDGWYHNGIHYCLDWGLMSGCDPVSFVPGNELSGGMMAQMLYNLAGRPELPGKSFYTGTGVWYDTAVNWAVGAGVLNVDEGFWKFSPDENVTREQLAMMLWRYAGRPLISEGNLPFSDAGALSPWAVEAARWAAHSGILNGRENGCLDPGGKVTRAEAASMLVRFLEGTSQI